MLEDWFQNSPDFLNSPLIREFLLGGSGIRFIQTWVLISNIVEKNIKIIIIKVKRWT